MTRSGYVAPPAFARVSADGLLLDAEPRLAELNRRAGGAPGQPVAVPQIGMLVALAGRLGITISRTIVAADGEDDLELTVTARPDDLGIRLEATGWDARAPWQPSGGGEADFLRADADLLWTTDASLHLTALTAVTADAPSIDPAQVLGRPVTRLFVLDDDGEGGFALMGAVAAQAGFDGQTASVGDDAARMRLAAVPRRDAAGRFAGFDGAAWRIVEEAEDGDGGPGDLSDAFSRRIGRALRDPLGRIIADADSMSAETEGPVGDAYAGYAADIAGAGRHLLALVDDLDDLSAIERADFVVSVEDLDLADVARRAAGLLALRAAQGDVRIDRPSLDQSMAASGEFRRVLQILVNLIGNAVRYSPPGGMVWIRLERDRESACVIVADQGKGIAPEDQERIFEKFGRVDPGEPGGSGLGLYIARRLARAMRGDILVDSAPGEGARFVLLLPAR